MPPLKEFYNLTSIKETKINWGDYFKVILILILCEVVIRLGINTFISKVLHEKLRTSTSAHEATSLKFIFIVVLLAPLVEELIFRLPLIVNRRNVSIAIGLIIAFIIKKFYIGRTYDNVLLTCLCLFTCTAISMGIFSIKKVSDTLIDFIKRNYLPYVYLLLTSFAFMHLLNYSNLSNRLLLFSPLIVFPYLLPSFVAAHFRLKYGLKYSILFHFLNNFLSVIALFILKENFKNL